MTWARASHDATPNLHAPRPKLKPSPGKRANDTKVMTAGAQTSPAKVVGVTKIIAGGGTRKERK